MDFDKFFDILQKRRSVRKYLPDEIKDDEIRKIILAGIQAPSGTNVQGWKFRIVTDKKNIVRIAEIIKEKINKLTSFYGDSIVKNGMTEYGGNFFFFENAPAIILLYAKNPNNFVKKIFEEGLNLYKGCGTFLSLGMVIQNMMLAASILGIGTCPLTGPLLAEEEINNEFEVPTKYQLSAVLSLGYPEIIPNSPGRKDIDKFIITDQN